MVTTVVEMSAAQLTPFHTSPDVMLYKSANLLYWGQSLVFHRQQKQPPQSYIFAVDDIQDDDIVLDYGKWSFIINKISVPYLNGMTLDYVKEGLNEFFKFINPKEQSSCGCGVSINFDLEAVEADEKKIFAVEV